MKLKLIRIISPILLISWMIFIFSMSAQEASVSSQTSAGFAHRLFSFFYPGFSDMDESSQLEIIGEVMFYIRKAAHFTIYCILGVLSFLTVITYKRLNFYLRGLISWVVCVLFAVSDELHQYFVPGRSCEIRDMLIDSSGALLATIILLALSRLSAKLYGRLKSH